MASRGKVQYRVAIQGGRASPRPLCIAAGLLCLVLVITPLPVNGYRFADARCPLEHSIVLNLLTIFSNP